MIFLVFPETAFLARYNAGTFTFEYYIKDHVGNVRISFDGTGSSATLRQENSFYPFGMTLPGNYLPTKPNENLYNNASEWQNDFSNLPDFYLSGARNYDPELGRFFVVDGMAELNADQTVYNYASNNPISNYNPSGYFENSPGGSDPKHAWAWNSGPIEANYEIADELNGEFDALQSGGGGALFTYK